MRFGVLGPFEVAGEDGPLALGGPKQRTVLAHLVLNVSRVVSVDHLIDALWGEEPPETARSTLQAYVSRLRSLVGAEAIESRSPGYALHVDPEEVDVVRFERLLRDARRTVAEPREAALTLKEALDLWRGPALADLAAEPSLSGEIARLEELRLQAIEERIAAQLDLGQHAQAVAELEVLTRAHPLRERLWGELMLSLYRLDRQAEALAAFDSARAILADQLGIDPSRELQELHERILRQDLSLDVEGEPLRGYRLLEQIGEGAFGVVFRALQPQVGREVAIKAVHPELANHPDFVRRFEREAQIVARLEHPHIVPLYDYWREPDAAYLVMRLLRGGSVETQLEEGPLDSSRVAPILDQVSSALAAAHRQGVVHRDVKPGNILLDEEGNAYLTDFGVALDAGSPERSSGTMMRGTPAYLSPEQIRLDSASPQSDVYALGIVLFEMLTGSHPFPDSSLTALLDSQLRSPIPSVSHVRPELPQVMDQVIARATAKDAGARFSGPVELAAAFRTAVEGAGQDERRAIDVRNPYKGLRAFLEADAPDFFGREAATARLIRRLADDDPAARFLAVVGPSGSGKSSVVRAGLLPALRRGALPGSERWYMIDLLPGSQPFREVEAALLGIAIEPPPSLLEEMERDELGLLRAAHAVLPDADSELVIVLDQLEEVFTLVDSEEQRARVLASLRAAVLEPGSRVRIVVTLRADFYDEPLMVRGFGDLLGMRTEAMIPMSLEELERAIVAPADRAGLIVEPGLLAAIFADVGDRPSSLPLLQYALTELAEHHDDGVLRLGIYRRIGGAWGALARRAERTFDGLDDPSRHACRQMFLRLVTLGEGGEDTRRRVRRSELDALGDPASMGGVIDTCGRHRLLSFDRDPDSREPTVEIAHEALLTAWGRLHTWIDDARDDLRTQRQLSNTAGEWTTSGRDESFLLRGARLDQIAAWAETTTVALSQVEDEYVRASIAERDAARLAEQARRDHELELERRSARRSRALVAVFAVAAIVAASLTVVARRQSDRAEREARVATTRALSSAALASLDTDPELSILLATRAVENARSADDTALWEAEDVLHRAMEESRVALRLPVPAVAVDVSSDGSRIATAGKTPGVAGSITAPSAPSKQEMTAFVWDAKTGERLLALTGHRATVDDVEFSPDGSRVATVSEDGTGAIWDGQTGERLLTLRGVQVGPYAALGFSPDGKRLVTTDSAGTVRVWDARTGRLQLRMQAPGRLFAAVFSPDGSQVMAGLGAEGGNKTYVWDADTGERLATLRSDQGFILWVAVSPDGSRIATAGLDGTARVWDAKSGEDLLTLNHGGGGSGGGWVLAVAFSPDGRLVATSGSDGTAQVWDVATGALLFVLPGAGGAVGDIAFSPDGSQLVGGMTEGTVVWDISSQGTREQATLAAQGEVDSVAFSPDGRSLLTAGWGSKATLWDPSSGRKVRTFPAVAYDAAFAPDGRSLVTGNFDGPVVWDVSTGQPVRELPVTGPFGSITVSPDGSLIATGKGGDDTRQAIGLWDASSGDLIRRLRDPDVGSSHASGETDAVEFNPDGSLLAAASYDETVNVWDVSTGEVRRTFHLEGGSAGVAFSPDGRLLAASGFLGSAKVWDIATGKQVHVLVGHAGIVWDVAWSPDGRFLATAGEDTTTRLWDARSGQELLTLGGHAGAVNEVAFNPDGTRLAAVSSDGTGSVYVLPVGDLINLARARLTRTWTASECRQLLHLATCPP